MKASPASNRALEKRHRSKRRGQKRNWCCVYGLFADDGQVMYVGQTRCRPESRLRWHMKSLTKGKTEVYKWMRWRIAAGETIGIRILEGDAKWDVSEIIWIERLRASGVPLANMTAGGRSSPGS